MIHSQFPLSSVVGFGCPSPPPESNACLQKVIKEQDLFDPQLLPLGWVGGQQPAQAPPAQLPPRCEALSVRQTQLDQSARPGHKPVSACVDLALTVFIDNGSHRMIAHLRSKGGQSGKVLWKAGIEGKLSLEDDDNKNPKDVDNDETEVNDKDS